MQCHLYGCYLGGGDGGSGGGKGGLGDGGEGLLKHVSKIWKSELDFGMKIYAAATRM